MKHADLLRKTAVMALSVGVSTALDSMGAGLLIKFLSTLVPKVIEELDPEKLLVNARHTHPSALNHHLQKALEQATNRALTNVQILYNDQLNDPQQKAAAKGLIDQLRAQVKNALLSPATETDRGVVNLLDEQTLQSADELTARFDAALAGLPSIDEQNPLPTFIRAQFVPQLQLCFGEELKKPEQHEAWVAYQRLLLNQLKESTGETLALSHETNRKLDELAHQKPVQFPRVSTKRLAALQNLLTTLDQTDIKLEDRFQGALDAWVTDLRSQMAEVVALSRETNQKVDQLSERVGQTGQTVQQFDRTLHQNWVSRYWLALALTVGAVSTAVLVAYTYVRNQPIDLTVFARPTKNLMLATDYPAFAGGELVLRLGNKDEENLVPAHGEVVVKQIPALLQGQRVAVRLLARYWQAAQDSVTLTGPVLNLALVPDGSLGRLVGNVRNETLTPVAGAAVTVNNDTTVFTDSRGVFNLELPYRMQHDNYALKIDKPGYRGYERRYYPKSGNIDIRLTHRLR